MSNGTTEQQVKIANRLYEARRVIRDLSGTAYPSQIVLFMRQIEQRTSGDQSYIVSGMQWVKQLTDAGDAIAVLFVLAAIVELIEPDCDTPAWELDGSRGGE